MPTVASIGLPVIAFFDENGRPAFGGRVRTFLTGTDTLAPTYTDSTGTVANPNPTPLNERGECTLWFDTSLTYDLAPELANGTDLPRQNSVKTPSFNGTFVGTDTAPVATGDTAPAQGLSFAINSVVDVARMANNFATGGDDTQAMQKAIRYAAQSGGKLYLRGGLTANMGAVDLSGVREFWGDGEHSSRIVTTGVLPAYGRLFLLNNVNGVNVRDLNITMSTSAYLTQVPFDIVSTSDVQLDNILFNGAGATAIRGNGNTFLKISKVRINNYSVIGIDMRACGTSVIVQDSYVIGTGLSHAIALVGGGQHEIRNNHTQGAKLFGASGFQCSGIKIMGNTFVDGYVEACNVQDTTDFQIIGNSCYQRRDGTATDFGMSVFGDPSVTPTPGLTTRGLIANNFIRGSYKSGIALAANTTLVEVTGNHITSPNTADEAFGAGVLLYGSGCQRNHVHGNFIVDEGTKMRWGVNEWVGYGDGAPSMNYLGQSNRVIGSGTLLGEVNLLAADSQAWDTNFVDFAGANITASTGTITLGTINSARYKRRGKLVDFKFDISITTNGTGAGSLNVTLPLPAVSNGGDISGRELGLTGKAINGRCNGSSATFVFYDNTYPGADGARIVASGSYEAA